MLKKVTDHEGREVFVGRSYTNNTLVKLADTLAERQTRLTDKELSSLIKQAGAKKMVVVTTYIGTVFTHVQKSKTTGRFTGYKPAEMVFGTFHPQTVKSFKVIENTGDPVLVPSEDTETEFRYF